MRRLGRKLFDIADDELEELITKFDKDGDGDISLLEFREFCMEIPHVAWKAEKLRFERQQQEKVPTQVVPCSLCSPCSSSWRYGVHATSTWHPRRLSTATTRMCACFHVRVRVYCGVGQDWREALSGELMQRATKAMEAKNYSEASRLLTEGIAMVEEGDHDVAKLDNKTRVVLCNMFSNRSGCRCGLGDYDLAMEDADKAIKMDPTSANGYFRKGQACNKMNMHDEAAKCYELAFEKDPSNRFFQTLSSQVLTDYRSLNLGVQTPCTNPQAVKQHCVVVSACTSSCVHVCLCFQVKNNLSCPPEGASTILSPTAASLSRGRAIKTRFSASGAPPPPSDVGVNTPNMRRRFWKDQGLTQPEKPIYSGTKYFWRTKHKVDVQMYEFIGPSDMKYIVVSSYNTTLDCECEPIFIDAKKITIDEKASAAQLEAARQEYRIRNNPPEGIIPLANDLQLRDGVQRSMASNFILLRLQSAATTPGGERDTSATAPASLKVIKLAVDAYEGSLQVDAPAGVKAPAAAVPERVSMVEIQEKFDDVQSQVQDAVGEL